MNITEYTKFIKFCELFEIKPTWDKLKIFENRGKGIGKERQESGNTSGLYARVHETAQRRS